MQAIGQRLGKALRRAPRSWLVATLLVFLVLLSPLAVLAENADETSTPLAIGATVLIAYGALTALVLAPRLIYSKVENAQTDDQIALLRWAFGSAPFFIGYAAVAVGSSQWSLSVGLACSVVLLVVAARAIQRSPAA